MRRSSRRGEVRTASRYVAAILAGLCFVGSAAAKDLGDILVEKGLITADELRQAREEEKQKVAVEESRRDAIAAKLPKWLDMVTPFGDVRIRAEGFYAQDLNARTRERLRARIGLNINPSDEIGATIRIASGNPDDPISTNQSFERTFSKKSLNLDLAYLTLRPGKTFGLEPGWGSISGGKMPVPAYRTSELIFDDDLSPEGAAETLNLVEHREGLFRGLKLNGFQWVVDEFSSAGDPWMIGGQIVGDLAIDDGPKITVAFADYSYQDMDKVARKFLEKSSSSFNSQLANSNALTRDADGKILGFDSNFNIVNFGGEVNLPNLFKTYSAGIFGEVAHNTAADDRGTGFALGAGFGNSGHDWYHNGLKSPGDWAVSYTYTRIGQDAVPAIFSYSDIDYVTSSGTQKGSTNVQASIVRFDYVLLPNFQLTAKAHFINALDRSASTAHLDGNATLLRTQLDAVLKF
jgi:Putative porin